MFPTNSRTFLNRLAKFYALSRYYGLVARSGLFDATYYLAQYDDVKQSGIDPLRHYLLHGGFEGRNPSELFLSAFYLSENQDLARRRENPLVHFIRAGDREGRRPNPFFDPIWYRTHNDVPISQRSTTLAHYIREGRALKLRTCDSNTLRDTLGTAISEDTVHSDLPAALATWRAGFPYCKWIERFDSLSVENNSPPLHGLPAVTLSTKFTIFLFVGPSQLDDLITSIRSLRAQIFGAWQAIIVPLESFTTSLSDDALKDPRCLTATWAQASKKVHESTREANGRHLYGILKPGEQLREHALLVMANAVKDNQGVDVIYADEDTRLRDGQRAHPIFKPDWDPLFFSTIDYLGSSTFVDGGLFPTSVSNSPCNLPVNHSSIMELFRVEPHTVDRSRVLHIPKVLLHTTHSTSFAVRSSTTTTADLSSASANASRLYSGGYPTRQADSPLVSIIIPTKKNRDLLELCIDSILSKTSYPNYEILLVDNDAEEDTKNFLATIADNPRCRVIYQSGPFNYSLLNNTAVGASAGELICLLNDDVQIGCENWLDAMVAFGSQSGVGAVGSVLYYPDGSIQHAGVVLGGNGLAAHAFVGCAAADQTYMRLAMYPREISAVTAACLLIEKSKFVSVGGLDAESLKVNFNDIDFCLRLRARGLINIVLPLVGMIHHESKTRGQSGATPESRRQLTLEAECMRSRWATQLLYDPYYNKNLSLSPVLYQLSSDRDSLPDTEPDTYRLDGDYTSLGRETRLDIYLDQSNQSRASEATQPSTIPFPSIGLPPGLSVIVLNKNSPELIAPLVGQLSHQQRAFQIDGLGFEILIGDTGSTDHDTLRLYENLPRCASVVRDMEYNFSRCNNQLEEVASYDTVLFLNNDIIFPPDFTILRHAFDRLRRDERLGIVGGVLLYPNGTIQHMGCEFQNRDALWGLPYHIHARKDPSSLEIPEEATYPSVTGAFLMIPRSLFRMCGRFDPKYRAECQDIALCLEAHRLGFRASCVNLGPIIHIENHTRPKGEENFSDRRLFLRRYGAYIQGAFE